jgi:hypothetical protein
MTSSTDRQEALQLVWEHDWETASRLARTERKFLLVDVEKDQ